MGHRSRELPGSPAHRPIGMAQCQREADLLRRLYCHGDGSGRTPERAVGSLRYSRTFRPGRCRLLPAPINRARTRGIRRLYNMRLRADYRGDRLTARESAAGLTTAREMLLFMAHMLGLTVVCVGPLLHDAPHLIGFHLKTSNDHIM
jgi:hypothetical protein